MTPGDAMAPGDAMPPPPDLMSLSPSRGSGNTRVTIVGEGFSTIPAENHVYFDSYLATVLSATDTELVVHPGVALESGSVTLAVSVEVGDQASNALEFTLMPSGTAQALDIALPSNPTGAVELGSSHYIAARSGLFVMDATGNTSRIWEPATTTPVADSPVALATHAGDVYFITALGSVQKLEVSTGLVTEVLPPGDDGPSSPSRTGITFAGAVMYIADRNLDTGIADSFGGIFAFNTVDATTFTITDPNFAGSEAPIFGINSDGTDLWVTSGTSIYRVDDPAGLPTVARNATAQNTLQGVALIDLFATPGAETVIASDSQTHLMFANRDAVDATLSALNGDTYGYQASGIATNAAGDMLLAQPDCGCVSRVRVHFTGANIISAGMRIALATVRDGTTTYLSTYGPSLLSGAALMGNEGAIVSVTDAGVSRVLADTDLALGMIMAPSGHLIVSECLQRRVYTLDVETGEKLDLLDPKDGLVCPSGIALGSAGELYLIETALGSPAPSAVHQLVDTTLTEGVVTGLSAEASFLARVGTNLIVGSLNGPVQTAPTAGGVAATLVPQATIGDASLAASPDGRLYAFARTSGDINEIDTATGAMTPLGTTLLPGATSSLVLSAAFDPDGTIVAFDYVQGPITITP